MAIDLHYVDEVIRVKRQLHGGNPGAPPLIAHQIRAGASLNRSCIVLLSALLQTFVEEVFEAEVKHMFPRLNNNRDWKLYWNQVHRWGNPSDDHIQNLFLKLGIPDVLDRLSWQGITTPRIKENLKLLNEIGNDIAHGDAQITFNGQPFSLRLADVVRLRKFTSNFGVRFGPHVQSYRQ